MLFKLKIFLLIFILLNGINLPAQFIVYRGLLKDQREFVLKNKICSSRMSICNDAQGNNCIYSETQQIKTDAEGSYTMEIGSGKILSGTYSSIIWSDGEYFLFIESDSTCPTIFKHRVLMRMPTIIDSQNMEGTESADTLKNYGTITIQHSKKKRPRKITIDLSSSYVNIAYPGDGYPIYRHYEWVDPDLNGLGNSLELTYSEKTNHALWENSQKLGEVKLYAAPFQELFVSSGSNQIVVNITKPKPIDNLNQTYAVKGPWKIIYFIEW